MSRFVLPNQAYICSKYPSVFPVPSQVAYVVKKNGLLSKWQNILVGYGIPFGVLLVSLAMNLYHYGGTEHRSAYLLTP